MQTFKIIAPMGLLLLVAGCGSLELDSAQVNEAKGDITATSTFGAGPEQVWVEKAKSHFKNGEYGLAERFYRQAIEERHRNIEAWLGLAASYDNLKRFDEADKAYDVVLKITGRTATTLNNIGFHHMLKGDFATAERTLIEAQSRDPSNSHVRDNLALLDDWKVRAGRRS